MHTSQREQDKKRERRQGRGRGLSAFRASVALGMIAAMLLSPGMAAAQTTTTYPVVTTALSGAQEVPPVNTSTTGTFRSVFQLMSGTSSATSTGSVGTSTNATTTESRMHFMLEVWNGRAITMAHLHCVTGTTTATSSQTGPVVAPLFGMVEGGFDVSGMLANFTLMDRNILPAGNSCVVPVRSIADLKRAMDAGAIYVNVHSVEHPNGVIRGNIAASGTSTPGVPNTGNNGTSTATSTPGTGTGGTGTSTGTTTPGTGTGNTGTSTGTSTPGTGGSGTSTATSTVTLRIMKHLCPSSIQTQTQFNNLGGFFQKLANCPTIVQTGHSASAGSIAGSPANFGFTLRTRDQNGNQNTSNAPGQLVNQTICENEAGADLNANGSVASSTCIDASHYVYTVPNGDVTFEETGVPSGTRFGTIEFTPTSYQANNDAASLISSGAGLVNLNVRGDTNRDITVHVFNWRDGTGTSTGGGTTTPGTGSGTSTGTFLSQALLNQLNSLVNQLMSILNQIRGA